MKKFLKYSGLIALGLVVAGFVLTMVTRAFVDKVAPAENWISSAAVLFGKGEVHYTYDLPILGKVEKTGIWDCELSGAALTGWIFALISILSLAGGAVLPLLKVKLSDKVAACVNLGAVVLLITAGIVTFCSLPSFVGNNDVSWMTDNFNLSFGWVLAGIFYLVAGAIAICPTVVDFISKKK